MSKTDLSFALGLAIKNLNLNPAELNDEQISELQFLAQDALLDTPTTKEGKKLKFDIIREKANESTSEYVKGFSFGQNLVENKVKPASVFLAKLISENMEEYLNGDHKKNDETIEKVSAELIKTLNSLDYPLDYLDNFFKNIGTFVNQLKNNIEGQRDFRKDQILALAIGVKHPTYDKLDSRVVSFKNLDDSIEKLRKDYNFTEDDYRS